MTIFELPWFTVFFTIAMSVLSVAVVFSVIIVIQDKIKRRNKK